MRVHRSARLDVDEPVYASVYAIALNSRGDTRMALHILRETLIRHPDNREVLGALVSFSRDSGDLAAAARYAEQLRALDP